MTFRKLVQTWHLAGSVGEHMTRDLGVVSFSPMLSVDYLNK